MPGSRSLNFLGFFVCAGLMAYALYAEHQLGLEPCPLCVFQRLAVIGLGIGFLLAAIHNPAGWGKRIYAAILTVVTIAGVAVAGRHVWLQNLPPEKLPSCGPGLDYLIDSFPLADALKLVFTGSGECGSVDWSFLGLTMPAWVLISIIALGTMGIANNRTGH